MNKHYDHNQSPTGIVQTINSGMDCSEQRVAMLSAVPESETLILTSIRIIEAFPAMRNFLLNNASIFRRI